MTCHKSPIFFDSSFDCDSGAWVAQSLERFFRAQIQSHGSFGETRQGNSQGLILNSALCPITTTDIRHHHPYTTQWETEHTRDLLAKWEWSLSAAPNSYLLVLEISHRHMRLKRIMLGTRKVIRLFKNVIAFLEDFFYISSLVTKMIEDVARVVRNQACTISVFWILARRILIVDDYRCPRQSVFDADNCRKFVIFDR